MANKTNTNVARTKDNSNQKENAFQHYSARRLSSRKSQSKENPLNDDLIVSLSDAYENKRARQVTEWERRQNVQYAA
ncbi:MAG: hypothetical protein H7070_08820 [Saprospiraceae bacterium]|nr:hypothetical protein [Pyrinomonadaceae bacterium]